MICRDETETVDILSANVDAAITILPPGTRLGFRYTICDVIGIGGSSVVYSADDSRTSRTIAVKVLRPDRSTEAARMRFRREAAVAQEIDCPQLVRVLDYTEGPPAYMTMILARKGSLRHALKHGPLPVAAAISIAEQVLCALSALHDHSIIHCDVKPGNILLSAGARIQLGDLGLAHQTNERLEAGGNNSVIGTLEYLAPEQALGRAVDARTDLYALGIILFEMLTGKRPHRRPSSLGTLLAQIREPAQNVRKLRPAIPQWLATLIARLLDKQPRNRYVSAGAVLYEISGHSTHDGLARNIAHNRGIAAQIVGTGRPATWRFQPEGS